ncbi:MAG: hypothetical protein AB7R89_09490 [Dehalococcoidia bacterium]
MFTYPPFPALHAAARLPSNLNHQMPAAGRTFSLLRRTDVGALPAAAGATTMAACIRP